MLTPEQLFLRKTGIGGSDAAAIVGLSKYATALDVYLDKTNHIVRETTDAMQRGNILEPFCRSLFQIETGYSVDMVSETQRSANHSFMIANLDGYLPTEKAIAEFKTADYATRKEWGEEGSDEIPDSYLIQVAHYASVMDLDTVYIGVLFGDEKLFNAYCQLQRAFQETGHPISFKKLGCDFRVYVYKKHNDLTRKLIHHERSFWHDHVEKGIKPSPKEGKCEDLLKAYPKAEDRIVRVSEEDLLSIQRLASIKKQRQELEKLEESAKADVLSLFGEASLLVDHQNQKIATWKNKSITRFDGKDFFMEKFPHLCEKLMKTTTTRELRIL